MSHQATAEDRRQVDDTASKPQAPTVVPPTAEAPAKAHVARPAAVASKPALVEQAPVAPVSASTATAQAGSSLPRPTGPGTAEAPAARIFRDDPRLDRRIIEGMLRDRDTFIAKMGREGYTEGAVLRRAAELGLSEALIRQVKSVAADLAGERPGRRGAPASLGARTCLSCDRIFLSSGPGNRLCMRCRGGDAGLAQL